MQWDEVWKIVFSIIVSFGGAGAIIVTVIKFSANKIANRLEKKYELKLNKELETLKVKLEGKSYISKTRFDAEFQIYQKLSQVTVNMVKDIGQLFPIITRDCRDDYDTNKNKYDSALERVIVAQDVLSASAPFISEEIYLAFIELGKKCKIQLIYFFDFRVRPDRENFMNACKEEYWSVWDRTTEISDGLDIILKKLREYLSSLDVIE